VRLLTNSSDLTSLIYVIYVKFSHIQITVRMFLFQMSQPSTGTQSGSIYHIRLLLMMVLPALLTWVHSGAGNSYCPLRMRFFMPGEMAMPWLL